MVCKIYRVRKQNGTKLILALCSSTKYLYTIPHPPPPPGGQRKFREEGGPKGGNFRGGGGCLERLCAGSLRKIGESLIYNSFSSSHLNALLTHTKNTEKTEF